MSLDSGATGRMTIRYVLLNAYAGGGTVRTTFASAGALAALGHDVEVVSVRRYQAEPLLPRPPGVRLISLTASPEVSREAGGPGVVRRVLMAPLERGRSRLAHPDDLRFDRFSLATDLALRRYFRQCRDGVLIGTRPSINLMMARFAPSTVVRVAQEHIHLGRATASLRSAYGATYGRLDAVVTLTAADAEEYGALLAGCRARVTAISNAAPPAEVARAATSQARTVVAAGRLTRQKGFDLLLKAWQKVSPKHPGWRLVIHGEGRLRPRLEERIEARGLGAVVDLPGFTPDLDRELREAGLFVLSSRFEGFPMVLLEAMSAALPVVAFDCPTGPGELIRDGVDGLLVEPESVTGLAVALDRALGDPQLRRRLAAAASTRAADYSLPAIAGRWERLLRELSGRPAADPPPTREALPGRRSRR